MSSKTIWPASSNKDSLLPEEAFTFLQKEGLSGAKILTLAGDGSSRGFFRLIKGEKSLVLIVPAPGPFGLAEAWAYYRIGLFLASHGLPVPQIVSFEEKTGLLLVEDLGDTRLEDLPPRKRLSFYPQALELLVSFQRLGREFDLSFALEGARYDENLMWEREALYFVRSFLQNYLGFSLERGLLEELKALHTEASSYLGEEVLLHRDFQSRNLMVKEGLLRLIDFQGARLGPPAYDLASLLFDPYACLGEKEREDLLRLYLKLSARKGLPGFYHFVLFRLFQALGAFAKLTLAGKTWFKRYIPQAVIDLTVLVQERFSVYQNLLAVLKRVEKELSSAKV